MVTMTENARTVIRMLTSTENSGLPEGAGMRMAADGDAVNGGGVALTVSLAPQPEAGDEVLEQDGARLFLEPRANVALDSKTIDAGVDEDRSVTFAVLDGAPEI